MTSVASDRSRAWRLAGRLLIVIFFALVVALAISGVHVLLTVVVALAVAMAGSLLLSPQRSWWGPEPAKILSDPVRMAAYRKGEIPFLAGTFVVIVIVLPMVIAFLSVRAQQ